MPQNKAAIERGRMEPSSATSNASDMIKKSADCTLPEGFKYQASAVVHLYQVPGTHNYAFVCHMVGMEDIAEAQADVALKELKTTMMKYYGRTPPAERTA